MKKLTLYYSVQNGGDGSAYPTFMSSKELAEYDQAHMDEGWGEPCVGSITLESESPITTKEEITTPESYLVNLIENIYDKDDENKVEEFIKHFFSKGKPVFKVEIDKKSDNGDGYLYNNVFANGVKVARIFRDKKDSGKKFENLLNK